MVFEPSFAFCPWCFLCVPPTLCPARSFSRGQKSQIAKGRDLQGRRSWQAVPGCEQLCQEEQQPSSGVHWEKDLVVGRQGWRCLGLGLHTVPGQGDMARAWIAVKSESHSLPGWVCWEWLSPRGSQGSLRLLNPKKWQQFSNIIF